MQLWAGLDAVPPDFGPCVVTIGMFDGVHRGHRELVRAATAQARTRHVPCVAVTFEPHPVTVLSSRAAPARLTTPAHRSDLLHDHEIDAVLVIGFTPDFAEIDADTFVRDVLVDRLHAVAVVVGANFTYGRGGAGTAQTLARSGEQEGFTAVAVPLLRQVDQQVSATAVRALVATGDVHAAAALLGHPLRCDGVVVRGEQRGRALGYPTANIDFDPASAVPADGVYAGRVVVLDTDGHETGQVLGVSAISVGTNPTFEGTRRTVEAFILDFEADLYGDRLGVEFHHRLRGMERFDSIDALIEQMDTDVAHTRTLMAPPVRPPSRA